MRSDSLPARAVQKVAASDLFAKVAPAVVPRFDRALFHLSGGRVLISRWLLPSIVLTTTGRRSGLERETPLAAVPLDGDLLIVGSNFGRDNHPAWSSNLLAQPYAVVEHDGEEFPVRADLLTAEQKAEVWPRLVAVWPPFDRYVERSGRDLRVFRLVRLEREAR